MQKGLSLSHTARARVTRRRRVASFTTRAHENRKMFSLTSSACAPAVTRAVTAPRRTRTTTTTRVGGVSKRQEDLGGLGGDIGARDPTAGEIESGFTSKSLGHADTDHILQVPQGMAEMIMLVNKTVDGASEEYTAKLDFGKQEVYRKQVWDWKIRPGRGNFECLRREFSTADGDAEKLVGLVRGVCEANGWTPATCEATSGSKVLVELGNDGIKGMCVNDFIVAAKIDACEEAKALIVKEAPKARNWF